MPCEADVDMFRVVKQEADLKAYCRNHLEPKGDTWACPACHSGEGPSHTPALKVYDDGHWYCYSCERHGDVFDMAGLVSGTEDKAEQLKIVAEEFGVDLSAGDAGASGSFWDGVEEADSMACRTVDNVAQSQPNASWGVEEYARRKRIDAKYLKQSFGLSEFTWKQTTIVEFPYMAYDSPALRGNEPGKLFRDRYRYEDGRKAWAKTKLGEGYRDADGNGPDYYKGRPKDATRPNTMCPPYGWWMIKEKSPSIIIVEGESDTQTLWYAGDGIYAAVGVPGANNYTEEMDRIVGELLEDGGEVYVHDERDKGDLTGCVYKRRQRFKVFACKDADPECKDPSELFVKYGKQRFCEMITRLLEDAKEYEPKPFSLLEMPCGKVGQSGRTAIERGHAEGQPPVLIDGIMRVGSKLIIGGPSKSFKSWLALQFCVATATGGKFLGQRCHEATVAYFNFENREQTSNYRLDRVALAMFGDPVPEEVLARLDRNLICFDMLGDGADLDKLTDDVADWVATAEREGRHVDIIVIDPVYKAMTCEENSNTEVAAALKPLDRLLKDNVSVVYTHHFKKSWRTELPENRLAGAGAFTRDCYTMVLLSPSKELTDKDKGHLANWVNSGFSEYDTVEHAIAGGIVGFNLDVIAREFKDDISGYCYVEGKSTSLVKHVKVPDGVLSNVSDPQMSPSQRGGITRAAQAKEDWGFINTAISVAIIGLHEKGIVDKEDWPTCEQLYDAIDWASLCDATGRTQPEMDKFRAARWLKNGYCEFELQGTGKRAKVSPKGSDSEDDEEVTYELP